jgi:hypothetical protein
MASCPEYQSKERTLLPLRVTRMELKHSPNLKNGAERSPDGWFHNLSHVNWNYEGDAPKSEA